MTYEEIINAVENGAKFTINFQKRTCRVNGKVVMSEEDKPKDTPYLTPEVVFVGIEQRYAAYKNSVPSERSESHRRYYFKALPEKELSDEDMMYGERRELARCKLELYVLIQLLRGNLWWNNSWGTWFWCSKNDKDLIILRDWIEPNMPVVYSGWLLIITRFCLNGSSRSVVRHAGFLFPKFNQLK